MRNRAGVVLVENNKVALIERHRAGKHYFVFPGGGVDRGETPEQAAVREAEEELGLRVRLLQKVVEIEKDGGRQFYYLAERVSGEFGTGTGEEMSNLYPDHPRLGIHLPIWMATSELSQHGNIYPAGVAELVVRSMKDGWPKDTKFIKEQK